MDQRRWRADKTGKVFRRLASDVNRCRGSSIDRIATLVDVALDRLGGVTGFARLWIEHLNRASALGKVEIVLRQMAFMANLMLAIEQPRRRINRETLDHATDEELLAERDNLMIQLLVNLGETDQDARAMVERIAARCAMEPPLW
jgi:hypothetical protein